VVALLVADATHHSGCNIAYFVQRKQFGDWDNNVEHAILSEEDVRH